MSAALAAYGSAAALVFALAGFFWSRRERHSRLRHGGLRALVPLLVAWLAATALLWSVYLERPTPSFEHRDNALALVIAIDLSPSMLAIPDPATTPDVAPRYERGLGLLLALVSMLEERDVPVIVSVVGFTKQADIIMGWDEDTSQVRETLEYAVSPALFNSFGTSLEAAVVAIRRAFDLLPRELAGGRRVAILVSDGEDTMYAASLSYAIDTLAELDAEMVAIQTGLLDRNEGIPVYDGFGEFTGFHRVGGTPWTVPDPATMDEVAGSVRSGLYLRAENPAAAERLEGFVLGTDAGNRPLDAGILPLLVMFLAVAALTGWILR